MNGISWKNHFIELFIVIIGISVAFWLNNQAEEQKERKLEVKFINDLREDLIKDSLTLHQNIQFNERKVRILRHGIKLIKSDEKRQYTDSIIQLVSNIGNIDFFVTESFTLTSLLQSGDIKLITSDPVKKELLRLLKNYELIEWNQRNLLQALDDNYFPLLLEAVDMTTGEPLNPAFFYGVKVKNYCSFTISDTNNHLYEYRKTQKQIRKLLEMMENY